MRVGRFSSFRRRKAAKPKMLERSFWAEVIVGDEHVRLFSEETPSGVQASVYNVKSEIG